MFPGKKPINGMVDHPNHPRNPEDPKVVRSFLRGNQSAGVISLIALGLCLGNWATNLASASKEDQIVPPGEALFRLRDGNDRFVTGRFQSRDYNRERKEQLQAQHPYAIVLTCSDSRVPPEILFDESLGRLFVLRVAGNVLDPVLLGTIEYAAEHLHVGLLLVLGHDSCGAVKATLSDEKVEGNLEPLIQKILPAVEKAKKKNLDGAGTLNESIQENVRLQMQTVMNESKILRELIESQKLWIVGGVYSLQTGKVNLLFAGATAASDHAEPTKNSKQ